LNLLEANLIKIYVFLTQVIEQKILELSFMIRQVLNRKCRTKPATELLIQQNKF